MHVIFVNPPNHRRDVDELAPPLGLLVLAEALLEIGIEVGVVDFNLNSCAVVDQSSEDFYQEACQRILTFQPDIVCFTSMGVNSHVSLELAKRLKSLRSSLITVFGGPHFSAISTELQKRFPWVDFVIDGAGEVQLSAIVAAMQRGDKPPFKHTTREGRVPQRIKHPWSAYSKIILADYFKINARRVLNFETGRGCKYKCRFCYSPAHWSDQVEASIHATVADFKRAVHLGAKHLFLVQDNFLNEPQHAAALCLNLAELSQRPTWNCYGTLRDIGEETPRHLSLAGCASIYIGIDAATSFQKKEFGKSAYDQEVDCIEKIKMLVASSVIPTCAFIIDTLQWSEAEVEASLQLALKLRQLGAELSLHFLTAYNKTYLGRRSMRTDALRQDDFRVRLMFDCPKVVIENRFAADNPELFPFHVRNCESSDDFRHAVATIHVAQHLIATYPYEIADLVKGGDISIYHLMRTIVEKISTSDWDYKNQAEIKITSQDIFERMLCCTYGFKPLIINQETPCV